MEPDEQLSWERRVGRPAGIAAAVGGALLVVGLLYTQIAGAEIQFLAYERALQAYDRPDLVIVPNLLQIAGYAGMAFGLTYLARAVRARRPEAGGAMGTMALFGPAIMVAMLVTTLISGLTIGPAVNDLDLARASTAQTGAAGLAANDLVAELAAKDVAEDNAANQIVPWLRLVANLAIGFALVTLGINAMRAGLLSRVMGILGVVIGVLFVLFQGAGLFAGPWLVALGSLFLNRWPNGRGPAWETVEAIPWPSATAAPARRDGNTKPDAAEPDAAEPDAEPEPDDSAEPTRRVVAPHPASKKRRKRKRR